MTRRYEIFEDVTYEAPSEVINRLDESARALVAFFPPQYDLSKAWRAAEAWADARQTYRSTRTAAR